MAQRKRVPGQGAPRAPRRRTPKQEMRISAIQIAVRVDMIEDGEKTGEGFYGPQGEEGPAFTFFNQQQVMEFLSTLPSRMNAEGNGGQIMGEQLPSG